jgi:hypothetical protein
MPLPRSILDPEGYYARLGVAPSSGPEIIAAAYRREARRLHPDVPDTGDTDAFVALKQAYDVLANTGRRAAYDRSAQLEASRPNGARPDEAHSPRGQSDAARDDEPGEIGPVPFPEVATPPTRHPRLRDLPVAVWAGMAVVLMVGAIEIALHLTSGIPHTRQDSIPPNAREVPPPALTEPMQPSYGPAPVRLAGTPNFYVMPMAGPSTLWRSDDVRHTLVPWGTLPPFSAVQGLRMFKSNGMVEVKVTDSANGFIEAGRLTPGDAAAAARAWCSYNAGPTPANGEVLTRAAAGKSSLSLDNQSGQPAVVKIRSADGSVAASVFLGPGGQTTVDGLPDEPAHLDFATGEVWSRACHGFAASMRAQRLPNPITIGPATGMTIPPAPSLGPVDLSDQGFEQE